MTTENQDVSIVQGDSVTLTVTVTSGGVAKNLTSATIKWSCARSADGSAALSKTTSSGITITNAAGGIFQVALSKTDTAALLGYYYHEAEVTDAGGNVSTVMTGHLTVTQDLIA
jgi:hypothetical protein